MITVEWGATIVPRARKIRPRSSNTLEWLILYAFAR